MLQVRGNFFCLIGVIIVMTHKNIWQDILPERLREKMSIRQPLKNTIILLATCFTLVLAACTPTAGEPSVPADENNDSGVADVGGDETAVSPTDEVEAPEELEIPLQDIIWVLQSYAGQPVMTGTDATIEFGPDGQLSGSGSCNNFFGSYQLDGENLTIDGVGSTEMWCEGFMDQETAFLGMLMKTTGVSLVDGILTINTADGDLVFAEAVDVALEETEWQLNAIAEENGVVSTQIDAEITVQFVDGSVTGFAGCNQFSGSYVLDGDAITIGELVSTLMACDEEHNQRETQFLTALAQTATYQIDRNSLRLLDEAGNDVIYMQVNLGKELSAVDEEVVEELIVAPEEENVIPGRYIVMLKPELFNDAGETADGKTVSDLAEELVALTNGELDSVIEIINGFVVGNLDAKDVTLLTKNPMVMSLEADRIISIDPIERPSIISEKTIFVGAEKVECEGVGPQECLLVKESVDGDWELFYDEIVGFTWEAGFEYELRIRVDQVENPPADGSSILWTLLDVVAKTAASE